MLQIEHVPLDSLVPADYNPRRMPDAQMAALMRSLSEFGWVDPVVVNSNTGRIVGGHQRVEAAKRLQAQAKRKADRDHWATVPVVWVDLTEGRERALNVALNKISGEFDLPKLADLLQGLDLDDFGFTGFTSDELDALVASVVPEVSDGEPAEGMTDPDEVPEAPAEPITKPGDLWILGRHRLLCGDSMDRDAIAKLYAGATVDVILTDPPYCSGGFQESGRVIGSVGTTNDNHKRVARDNLTTDGLRSLIEAAIGRLPCEGAAYVFCDWRQIFAIRQAVEPLGYQYRALLVWDKETPGMGGPWRHQYELCYFGTRRKEPTTGKSGDVLRCKRSGNAHHTTEKPVDLIASILGNTAGNTVADPFAGSGTTMIAAELSDWSFFGMELDPAYVDVAVKRWEQMTGQKARLEGSDAQRATEA